MTRPSSGTRRNARVRCAIYTRKSSEEGLDQQFNSLQAQREACEAFITSQRHEGWVCLRAGYDDGGFSGATMGRPALQRLLADIAAGRVDIVVVYKIDRLTRSLADDLALELRKGQQNIEGQAPHRGRGVELLRHRNKRGAPRIEDLDDLGKIGEERVSRSIL